MIDLEPIKKQLAAPTPNDLIQSAYSYIDALIKEVERLQIRNEELHKAAVDVSQAMERRCREGWSVSELDPVREFLESVQAE